MGFVAKKFVGGFGALERRLASTFDGVAHDCASLRPAAVIHPHRRMVEDPGEREPRQGRSVAEPAVGNDFGLVARELFEAGLKRVTIQEGPVVAQREWTTSPIANLPASLS